MAHPSPLTPVALAGSSLAFVVDNMPDTEIRPSAVHGHGLYAARDFAAGEVLGWLDGQVVDWESWDRVAASDPYAEAGAELFMEWNALATNTLLIRPFRTKYSYLNHSRTPNARIEHGPLRVVTAQAVAAGTELTLDYRREPLREAYLRKATYL